MKDKIKTLIIDDEIRSCTSLSKLLGRYCKEIEVIGIEHSVKTSHKRIIEEKPDLIFLDIEMPKGSGFDLVNLLPVDNRPEIVFVTAYDQYAINAIKVAALDYLLKPVNIEELKEAVQKASLSIYNKNIRQNLSVLLNNMNKGTEDQQIAIPTLEGYEFFLIQDIVYCEADRRYTTLFMNDGEKAVATKNLKEFEIMLSDYNFHRIHNSYVINLSKIKKYVKGDGGYVVMKNGKNIDVSRRKKETFLEALHTL